MLTTKKIFWVLVAVDGRGLKHPVTEFFGDMEFALSELWRVCGQPDVSYDRFILEERGGDEICSVSREGRF